jgi:hypothetical protein
VYYARGGESWAGTVEVRSPSEIRYGHTLEGADGRLRREISSIAGHRWHLPYEEADGRHRLELDAGEHPLGRLVRVEDGMRSSYRIQGGLISQINREMGGLRFSINIQERVFTGDGRTLPVHSCVVYWDADEDRLLRTELYRDGYLPVGGVHLPLSRRIIIAEGSGITTCLILFRDHRLLNGDAMELEAGRGAGVRGNGQPRELPRR